MGENLFKDVLENEAVKKLKEKYKSWAGFDEFVVETMFSDDCRKDTMKALAHQSAASPEEVRKLAEESGIKGSALEKAAKSFEKSAGGTPPPPPPPPPPPNPSAGGGNVKPEQRPTSDSGTPTGTANNKSFAEMIKEQHDKGLRKVDKNKPLPTSENVKKELEKGKNVDPNRLSQAEILQKVADRRSAMEASSSTEESESESSSENW